MDDKIMNPEISENNPKQSAWITPSFECLPLNEALIGGGGAFDGETFS